MDAISFLKQKGLDTDNMVIADITLFYKPSIPLHIWLDEYYKRKIQNIENEIGVSDATEAEHGVYADVRNLECVADSTDAIEQTSSAALETRIDSENEFNFVCSGCGSKHITPDEFDWHIEACPKLMKES